MSAMAAQEALSSLAKPGSTRLPGVAEVVMSNLVDATTLEYLLVVLLAWLSVRSVLCVSLVVAVAALFLRLSNLPLPPRPPPRLS